jgi:hypothetical protein
MSDKGKPGPDYSGSGPVEYNPASAQAASSIERSLASAEQQLMAVPGVVSVGIGVGGPGIDVIEVGVIDSEVAARLPASIGGVPISITVTGEIDAQGNR